MAQFKKNISIGGLSKGLDSSLGFVNSLISLITVLFVIFFFLKGYFSKGKSGKGFLQKFTESNDFISDDESVLEEKKKAVDKISYDVDFLTLPESSLDRIVDFMDDFIGAWVTMTRDVIVYEKLEPLSEDDFAYIIKKFGVRRYRFKSRTLYGWFDRQLNKSTKESIQAKTASFIDDNNKFII